MDNTSLYILAVLNYASPLPAYRVEGVIVIYAKNRSPGRGLAVGRIVPTPHGPRIRGFWDTLRRLQEMGLVAPRGPQGYYLTLSGRRAAEKAVRELREAGEDIALLARLARLAQSLSREEFLVLYAEAACGARCRAAVRSRVHGYDAVAARLKRYVPARATRAREAAQAAD